jgi:hypothetical protein
MEKISFKNLGLIFSVTFAVFSLIIGLLFTLFKVKLVK